MWQDHMFTLAAGPCRMVELSLNFHNGWLVELGTRQFRRENVTMLSGRKVVCNFHFTLFIVSTPSRH